MYYVSSTIHNFDKEDFKKFQRDLVSVIIPVYDKKKDLLKICINKIKAQSYKDIEIIIVNNGIKDLEKLIGNPGNIKIIDNERNFGASYARNQGALISKGEYLWFVDSDIYEIPEKCLENMVQIIKDNGDTGAIGGMISKFDNEDWLFLSRTVEKHYLSNKLRYTLYNDEYVNTASILIPRRVFAIINGFTDYIEYIHDDVDIGFKIRYFGFKCIVDYRALCYHPRPPRSHDYNFYKIWYKNAILFYLVNYRPKEFLKFITNKFVNMLTGAGAAFPDRHESSERKEIELDKSNKLLGLTYACLFLLIKMPKVFCLRRERQVFLISQLEGLRYGRA